MLYLWLYCLPCTYMVCSVCRYKTICAAGTTMDSGNIDKHNYLIRGASFQSVRAKLLVLWSLAARNELPGIEFSEDNSAVKGKGLTQATV
jgi:hypothetical protein